MLKPIRSRLPNLGGIDISPIILLLIIFFLRTLLWTTLYPLVASRPWSLFDDHLRLAVRLTPNGGRDAIDGIEADGEGEAS